MEYVNQEILNTGYYKGKHSIKGTSFIKKHKIMSTIIICTAVLSLFNIILIYEFMKTINTL